MSLAAGILATMMTVTLSPTSEGEGLWDLPTPFAAEAYHTGNILRFAKEVGEATSGALSIDVQPGAETFGHGEIAETVSRGLVPMGEVMLSRLAGEVPLAGLFSIPHVAADLDAAERLWEAARPGIAAALAERNLTLVFAQPMPGQALFLTEDVDALGQPAEGRALGVYDPTTFRLAEILGAVPVFVEADRLAGALDEGRVEALFAAGETVRAEGAGALAPQAVALGSWFPISAVIVNSESLAALPEASRAAFLDAATAAEARGWEAARDPAATGRPASEEGGLEFLPLSPEFEAALREAGTIMLDEWRQATGEAGAAILDTYGE